MKRMIPILIILLTTNFLWGQQKTEGLTSNLQDKAVQQTSHVVSLLKNMPLKVTNAETAAQLRAISKEQKDQLAEIHYNVYNYVDQVRQKYGDNTPEVQEEVDYQKSHYFKLLKKVLNTHQYFYLKHVHDAQSQKLIDVVDLNFATEEEVEIAKSRLEHLQSVNVLDFNQL